MHLEPKFESHCYSSHCKNNDSFTSLQAQMVSVYTIKTDPAYPFRYKYSLSACPDPELRPKIRICGLDGHRVVESKKFFEFRIFGSNLSPI